MSNLRKALAPIKKYPKTLVRKKGMVTYDKGLYGDLKKKKKVSKARQKHFKDASRQLGKGSSMERAYLKSLDN